MEAAACLAWLLGRAYADSFVCHIWRQAQKLDWEKEQLRLRVQWPSFPVPSSYRGVIEFLFGSPQFYTVTGPLNPVTLHRAKEEKRIQIMEDRLVIRWEDGSVTQLKPDNPDRHRTWVSNEAIRNPLSVLSAVPVYDDVKQRFRPPSLENANQWISVTYKDGQPLACSYGELSLGDVLVFGTVVRDPEGVVPHLSRTLSGVYKKWSTLSLRQEDEAAVASGLSTLGFVKREKRTIKRGVDDFEFVEFAK